MENNFRELEPQENQDCVISFLQLKTMFKGGEFMDYVLKAFSREGLPGLYKLFSPKGGIPQKDEYYWFNQGIECELLKPHRNWKKGKLRIKISLEFCPDEPDEEIPPVNQSGNESDAFLDDIRQNMPVQYCHADLSQ